MLYNQARFELEEYTEPILEESILRNIQTHPTPNFIHTELEENCLEDDSWWLLNGFASEWDFTTFSIGAEQPSSFTRYPHEYKITGMEIQFSYDVINHNRETYTFLSFLGDLGGLFDSLIFIGSTLLYKIVTTNNDSLLLSLLFQKKKPATLEEKTEFENDSDKKEYLEKKMKDEFQRRTPIPFIGFYEMLFCRKRPLKSKQR